MAQGSFQTGGDILYLPRRRRSGSSGAVSGPPGATVIDYNFAGGSSVGAAVTRATAAQVVNPDYSLSTVAINTPRISCDEIFATPAGLLIEGAAVNGALSPTLAGAVLGVVGSGGSFPTGWTLAGVPAGVTTTITAVDATGVEFTWTGTPGGTSGMYLMVAPLGTGGVPCSPGQVWCGSAFVRAFQVTGLTSPTDQALRYSNAAGTFISDGTYKTGPQPNTDKVWPEQQVRTLPATTAFLSYAPLNPVAISGTPINAKYRIERPQIEQSLFRTTFQPAATRAADVALATGLSTYFATASRTAVISFYAPRLNGSFNVWEERVSGGAANNRIELYTTGYLLKCKVVSGGSTLTDSTVGVVPILTRSTVALAISPTGIAVSLNGKAAVTAAITPPSGINEGQYGGGTTGFINSIIARATFYPTAQTAGQCATLSLAGVTMYDDFSRANGAVGSAPTGQSYVQVAAGGVVTVPTISSNRLVTADSGGANTAGYTGVDLGAPARLMSIGMRWSAATVGGTVALIENPNGLTTVGNITAASAHNLIASDTVNAQYWITGANNGVQTYVFLPAGALDGATEYNGAVAYPGDNSVVIVLPNGEVIRTVNANLTPGRGRYHTWEHFWNTGLTQPSFRVIAADGQSSGGGGGGFALKADYSIANNEALFLFYI